MTKHVLQKSVEALFYTVILLSIVILVFVVSRSIADSFKDVEVDAEDADDVFEVHYVHDSNCSEGYSLNRYAILYLDNDLTFIIPDSYCKTISDYRGTILLNERSGEVVALPTVSYDEYKTLQEERDLERLLQAGGDDDDDE